MNSVLPVGIDFGNNSTVTSIYKIDPVVISSSGPVIVQDCCGRKKIPSQIYFLNNGRLSGKAASSYSDLNPCGCVQFVKSSVKRDFDKVDNVIKKVVKCMKPDVDGKVEYVIPMDGKEKHIWPPYLYGAYISDRINEIKQSYSSSTMNVAISIPSNFSEDQIAEVDAGLNVAGVENYTLIREMDARAIDYLYNNRQNPIFNNPQVVLFMNIGFSECEVFAIEFSRNEFTLLTYQHSEEVSAHKIDGLLFDYLYSKYHQLIPNETESDISYYIWKEVLRMKEEFTTSTSMITCDINHHSFTVSKQDILDLVCQSSILVPLQGLLQQCIDACKEKTINSVEVCNIGLDSILIDKVLKSLGCQLPIHYESKDYADSTIACGCAEYAFCLAYHNDPRKEVLILQAYQSVHPINHTPISSSLQNHIHEAKAYHNEIQRYPKQCIPCLTIQQECYQLLQRYEHLFNSSSVHKKVSTRVIRESQEWLEKLYRSYYIAEKQEDFEHIYKELRTSLPQSIQQLINPSLLSENSITKEKIQQLRATVQQLNQYVDLVDDSEYKQLLKKALTPVNLFNRPAGLSIDIYPLDDDCYYIGTLKSGIPSGSGIIVNQTCSELIYEGEFVNGIYDGYGTLYSHNKLQKCGHFKKGQLIKGKYIHPSGMIQLGEFFNGNLHGEHSYMILPSGGSLYGKWDNGKPVGEFRVFLGAGRYPMSYDFSNKDDNTKFNISIYNDFIFYDDRYLLSANAKFLYFFNGDIFVGIFNSRFQPVDGILYHLMNNQYVELIVGHGLRDCEIAFDSHSYGEIHHAVIRANHSVASLSDSQSLSFLDLIPYETYQYEDILPYFLNKQ